MKRDMINIWGLVVTLLVFVGCGTTNNQITQRYSEIVWDDGISEEESYAIATSHLWDEELTEAWLTHSETPRVDKKYRSYLVTFLPSRLAHTRNAGYCFVVEVDKKSGDILQSEQKNESYQCQRDTFQRR